MNLAYELWARKCYHEICSANLFVKKNIKKIFKLFRLLLNPLYRKALFKGCAAAVEHEKVLKLICSNKSSHVIDIGSNKGQFALACRSIMPSARIDCFEPLEMPAKIFRSVFKDDNLITLHQLAISNRNEYIRFNISASDDSSSLLSISENQSTFFPGTNKVDEIVVQSKKLQECLCIEGQTQRILKIDTQGSELSVLEGAYSLLSQIDYIYVELSYLEFYVGQPLAPEVIDVLKSRHFELVGIYNSTYSSCGKALQSDFLFRRKDLTCTADSSVSTS